ncbi:hypothetical protein HZ326_1788 [Fusarium oxysporum f. sp. albedinis]|nr:hypothetical protein HZ326_1788 [Fusarium oxysporum f. sp. albedinis]
MSGVKMQYIAVAPCRLPGGGCAKFMVGSIHERTIISQDGARQDNNLFYGDKHESRRRWHFLTQPSQISSTEKKIQGPSSF